jgi:antitoxin HigA-1
MDFEEALIARPARRPAHPGALLKRQIIPALEEKGMTKVAIANALGIKRQSLYNLLLEKRSVTPEMAARLGRCFGNAPAFWLSLQANHDLWAAEQKPEVQAVARLVA